MSTSTPGISAFSSDTNARFDAIVRFLDRLKTVINYTGAIIVVITLSSMFVAIFVNVVLRYAFGNGIAWAYEIHNILFPWLVAGGAVMAAAKNGNIAVRAFVDLLPDLGRRVIAIAVFVFVAILCVGIIYSSMPIIKAAQYSRLAETGIQQMYGYFSLIYSFGSIALISAFFAIRLILGEKIAATDPTQANFS